LTSTSTTTLTRIEKKGLQNPRILVQEQPILARKREKDRGIESLRGIAIIMVIVCHVILDHKNPLYPNNPYLLDWLQHLCLSTEYVRMPLFTVISGFVYALRPAAAASAVDFVRGKARRLLIPFLFVTSLVVVLRGLLHQEPGIEIAKVLAFCLVNPLAQLWFLPSIFLCILTVGMLDILGQLKTIRNWLFWLTVMSVVEVIYFQYNAFGIDYVPVSSGFTLLLPFFTLGCGLNRFGSQVITRKLLWFCAAVVVAGLTYQQFLMAGAITGMVGKETPMGLIVGLAGTTLLIHFRPNVSWLSTLGNYSFSIYLYHYLFISLMLRIPFPDGGTGHAQLVARILGGLLLPILVEKLLKRHAITRRIGLGLR
jgi:peptidoglycan/LPS O-acetylase OafA/YrhL